jgi:four helix bundle protein
MKLGAIMKSHLSDRLVRFAGEVCRLVRKAPRDVVLDDVLRQLARSATSPAANYAEAREAVSTRDYVYRMKTCVKELRETLVWLEIAHQSDFKRSELEPLVKECRELIAMSVSCIKKATGR